MTPEIVALLINGGVEAGKFLLMAYFENQRVQGKTTEEIKAHIAAVGAEYDALGDPSEILNYLPKEVQP